MGRERQSAKARHDPTAILPADVMLPRPRLDGSCSLASALRLRRTTREIGDRPLPPQVLSDLLWAACGVNRRRGPFGLPGLTAASASNSQEINLFVAMADGAYRYEPRRHRLIAVALGDLRRLAIGRGQGGAGSSAPIRLIYVADLDRLANTAGFQEPGLRDPAVQRSYYFVDTGLIAANVYLFAAATGLAAWFHNCDRPALAAKLKLRADQSPLFGQTVGYPARRGRAPPRPADR